MFAADVNVPAMKTRASSPLPTTSMSQISPVPIRGVFVRGRSGTNRVCPGPGRVVVAVGSAATAGGVANPITPNRQATTAATAVTATPPRAERATVVELIMAELLTNGLAPAEASRGVGPDPLGSATEPLVEGPRLRT